MFLRRSLGCITALCWLAAVALVTPQAHEAWSQQRRVSALKTRAYQGRFVLIGGVPGIKALPSGILHHPGSIVVNESGVELGCIQPDGNLIGDCPWKVNTPAPPIPGKSLLES